jgi:hypothetical protein
MVVMVLLLVPKLLSGRTVVYSTVQTGGMVPAAAAYSSRYHTVLAVHWYDVRTGGTTRYWYLMRSKHDVGEIEEHIIYHHRPLSQKSTMNASLLLFIHSFIGQMIFIIHHCPSIHRSIDPSIHRSIDPSIINNYYCI